jgi:hypothetical protein
MASFGSTGARGGPIGWGACTADGDGSLEDSVHGVTLAEQALRTASIKRMRTPSGHLGMTTVAESPPPTLTLPPPGGGIIRGARRR